MNPRNKKIAIKREIQITADKNISNLKQALLAVDWSALQSSHDVNSAYDIFLSKFLEIYNRELPVINKNIRTYSNNHKPWVTTGILKSIHHKHNLYKRFIQNKDSKSESKYKTYKNKLTQIIRIAEKMYYANKFNLALGNIKKIWDIIKNIRLGCDHPNSQLFTEIKVDNNLITDSNIMANKFYYYFSKVGPILAKFQKRKVIFQTK